MRILFVLLGLFVAGGAGAEPDTFGLGSGRNGSRRIEDTGVVLNRYARLTADAAVGTSLLTVSDSTGFVAGELVLVHQSTGLLPAPDSGEQRPLHLDGSPVGRFEYARLASVAPGELRLSAPLLNGYAGNGAQVVAVPEFSELEVRTGASVRAEPWDGGTGGILAVLVTGRLRNDGLVTVEGAGFRGGDFLSHANLTGCTGLDEPVASGGAYKGEGLVAGRFGTASGRGNLANGGGGGICHNAGGGGGGHAGLGGMGGRSAPVDGARAVGGLGGAPVVYPPYERLLFGGGGGAGEGNNGEGTGGGAGGGLMLIRAGEVRGVGRFRAAGATPPPTARDDGAGGGGAGGAISIRARQELECGAVEAPGGAGGDVGETSFPVGPGGGGGGGVVFLQGQPVVCSRSVLAGAPGRTAADGGTHGSGPDSVDGGLAPGSAQV
ncbi:adventurous gliding motility protein AgmC, partial [Archangium sp.]|uniref:adventurous gliding motility protein AgmC n=1 Tax=Archangium sp. TaxID=1872627 RepID=UPI002EF97453